MSYILGIDTGGSYTDSVIIDSETKEILFKQKVLTTPHKLQCCIENSFKNIRSACLQDITMVCLSTTLATNSVVENHGCREGIILIGSKPNGRIPTGRYAVIHGRYDIKGRIQENIDPQEVQQVVESFRGKVDAIAISGYASVRNPTHELYVKNIVEDQLHIPVVCAHELTSDLGYYERTVTAALNARLIPLIYDLIASVKSVMKFYGVHAPLMIVRGDGTLMPEVSALTKPIDTILSGPAASVIGAMQLSGAPDCFVLDIGGTTTDIANVENGQIQIRNEGAKVGGWFTRVRAAEIFTVGLGGDSRIYIDNSDAIQIGPEKSIPLCRAGEQYPELIREIADIYVNKRYVHFLYCDYEAYILRKEADIEYSDEEKILLEVLRYYPHTLHYLIGHVSIRNLHTVIDRLMEKGVLSRISLTPTDILHVTGEYRPWNWVIAELGTKILAEKHGMGVHQFIVTIKKQIAECIDRAIIQAAMYFDRQDIDFHTGSEGDYFINQLFFLSSSHNLRISCQLRKKVIAIGAPAQAWMKYAGTRLHAEILIPEHADIANAYGAAIGSRIESIELLIRLDSTTGKYIVFSPLNRTTHDTLEQATDYALSIGEDCVRKLAGPCSMTCHSDIEDLRIPDPAGNAGLFIERTIHLTAALQN